MEETRTLHWLPCAIKFTGAAKVGAYFLPTPTVASSSGRSVDGKAVQEAYFRGRQLKGTQLQIPQGYKGQILQRTVEQHADGDGTPQWSPDMAFREIVYWKHGLDPICTDSAQRRMAFLKISEQLHAPIDPEEIQQELGNSTFGKTS